MAVIYEFSMIHDVHLKVMAEIKNQWNKMSTEKKSFIQGTSKKTIRDSPTTNGKIVATSSKRRGTNDLCVRVVLKCVNNVQYIYRLIKTRKLWMIHLQLFIPSFLLTG